MSRTLDLAQRVLRSFRQLRLIATEQPSPQRPGPCDGRCPPILANSGVEVRYQQNEAVEESPLFRSCLS